eukprot:comp5968_c0_seq1/m.1819 comp5968_c0_seq1/g.1819  ORF comp5968_c0_seq1/g.1819 comp5968_c0_seq1/m.1819 type:complete len:678 (-) comp5968_c0_seq1:80-2113(-)
MGLLRGTSLRWLASVVLVLTITQVGYVLAEDQGSEVAPPVDGDIQANAEAPPPPAPENELPPSDDVGKGHYESYLQANDKTSSSYNTQQALVFLIAAAEAKYPAAMERLAHMYLFGEQVDQDIAKAAEQAQALAKMGHADGNALMGFLHTTGLGVPMDQARATTYYTLAAMQGQPIAHMALGYRHKVGYAATQDQNKAESHYAKVASYVAEDMFKTGGYIGERVRLSHDEQASMARRGTSSEDVVGFYAYTADRGDVEAQVTVGRLYLTGGHSVAPDHAKAYQYLSKAAEAGSAQAKANLGQMYEKAQGPIKEPDLKKAFELYKESASEGNPSGQNNLGLLYLHGKGVDQDYREALRLFQMASKENHIDAQYNLGLMFFNGLGITRDPESALKMFQKAAEKNHSLALYSLALMYHQGVGTVRNPTLAVTFFKNLCERGPWVRHMDEGYKAYREGRYGQAVVHYMYAAELGLEVAQSNAAFILDMDIETVIPSEYHYQMALIYWQRAAKQGNGQARIKIGDYYYYGRGIPVDYALAFTNYRAAASDSNPQALFDLAYMHENGLGINQDFHLAQRYYDMAMEMNAKAKVPVYVALIKLNARQLWANIIDFIQGKGTPEPPNTKTKEAPAKGEKETSKEQENMDWVQWAYSQGETVWLVTATVVLAGLIQLRRILYPTAQ